MVDTPFLEAEGTVDISISKVIRSTIIEHNECRVNDGAFFKQGNAKFKFRVLVRFVTLFVGNALIGVVLNYFLFASVVAAIGWLGVTTLFWGGRASVWVEGGVCLVVVTGRSIVSHSRGGVGGEIAVSNAGCVCYCGDGDRKY